MAPSILNPGNEATPPPGTAFVRDISRLLLTFFAVNLIDLIFGSLLTGRWRLWFPQWIDPTWAGNPDSAVVYSQSYLSGVFLMPVLVWAIDREFLAKRGSWVRTAYWGTCVGAFAFIIAWKGGLMLQFHKQREAIAWGALTIIIYALIVVAQWLPVRLARLTRTEMLTKLMWGIATFFLVMSVLDPLLQVGVQHLDWSTGLIVEISFFIPAGIILLVIAKRLGRNPKL